MERPAFQFPEMSENDVERLIEIEVQRREAQSGPDEEQP